MSGPTARRFCGSCPSGPPGICHQMGSHVLRMAPPPPLRANSEGQAQDLWLHLPADPTCHGISLTLPGTARGLMPRVLSVQQRRPFGM